MDEQLDGESFEINPEFWNTYTFFLHKYAKHAFENANFNILELVGDLQTKLGCRAAALLQFDDNQKKAVILYPATDGTISLQGVVNQPAITKKISELVYDDRLSGETIQVTIPKAGGAYDVILIPMPRLADIERHSPYDQLFVLVDPSELESSKTNKPYHESQRSLISQFLCNWWVRALAPAFRRSHEKKIENEKEKKETDKADKEEKARFRNLWLSRRYIASPSVLIEEGIISADVLRSSGQDNVQYFVGEIEKDANDEKNDGRFEWAKWTPLKPGRDNLKNARKDMEQLVYWCRWMDSHHHLEREQTASSPTQPEGAVRIKQVEEWVQAQRKNPKISRDRLEKLRATAARAFISGGVEKIPPTPKIKKDEILFDHRPLLCFSLNHWLAQEGYLFRNLPTNAFGDVEFCRNMHSLAITAHYLLGRQHYRETDVIHRLMRMVAQYGHEDLGIPERIDLRAHLLQAARGELPLHALKPSYRDHFFHALEVCFLGHILLETKLKDGIFLWQLAAEHLHLPMDKPEDKIPVLRLWYTAALLHDIGYGMEVLKSSRDYFKFFKHSKALQSLQTSFKNATDSLKSHPEFAEIDYKDDPEVVQDHGVIGALHLHRLLQHIHEEDPSVDPEIFKPAVKAIALHSLRRRKDTISFSQEPLAFLLALCDQLQEWRRFQIAYSISPSVMLSRLSGASGEAGSLEGAVSYMKADLQAESDAKGNFNLRFNRTANGDPTLAFTMFYNKGINRNSGVFHTWLDATLNFQRLDFTGLPLDISITYNTPLFNNAGTTAPQQQLDRLKNAAFETHMPFMMKWFPNTPEPTNGSQYVTNGAISHTISKNANEDREELTIHLYNLAGKNLMTKNMKAFNDRLKEWKLYNEDREFPGEYANVIPD